MHKQNKLTIIEHINKYSDDIFCEQNIYQNDYPLVSQLGLLILLISVFSIGGHIIPANGFIGFDWIHFFKPVKLPAFYPPWADWVVSLLTWPTLIGFTLGGITLSIIKRSIHPISGIVAFFSLPLFWTLFLGQIDGLVILGLLGLPWLAPLVMIKPQVTIFAFLARRSYLVSLFVCLLLSFVIWGFWFLDLFSVWTIHEEGKYANDIALGLWGIPISAILLWFSRGDIDMLMAAGVFATPYLLPYNLIPLIPAISRLNPPAAIIASLFSWLPLTANWVDWGWYLGWLFIFWVWIQLARARYPQNKFFSIINKIDLHTFKDKLNFS
jgi:hypothetical protein